MQKLMQVIWGRYANYLSVTDPMNFICSIDRNGHEFEILPSTVKFLKIPQTNLEIGVFCSRFSVDSPTTTLTSVAHTADAYKETHYKDGKSLWGKTKVLLASLQN